MSRLLLLMSYHRSLRIISEVLELRVEGRRDSHNRCICVVSHGNGGLGGAEMEVVDCMHAGQSLGGGRMSRYAGAFSEFEVTHC